MQFHKVVLTTCAFLTTLVYCPHVEAQNNVGIGTQSPDASAVLDLSSTDKGLLIPRMTTAQRDLISSPADWLMIFNLSSSEFQYYNGTTWVTFGGGGGGGTGWSLTGNTGTSAPTNFLGTIDSQPLHLRVSNNVTAVFETNGAMHRSSGGNARGGSAIDLQYQASGAAVASGGFAAIGGGQNNTGSGQFSVIGGGQTNSASNSYAAVLGGQSNTVSGSFAAIGGGQGNSASNSYAFVGAGQSNSASAARAAVLGGQSNSATGPNAVVGAGLSNSATGTRTAVVGGQSNSAGGTNTFVGGGLSNSASNTSSGVGVGQGNLVSGNYSFIGGGFNNSVTASHSFVGGGQSNVVSGQYSSIPGGRGLTMGGSSFGFNASGSALDLSSQSSIAYLGDADLWLGNNLSNSSALRFYEPTNNPLTAQFSAFEAQAQAASINYILPAEAPANTDEFLGVASTSGNITLEWKAAGGSGWSLNGNSINNGEFLGTLNAEDLIFQTNGAEAMRIHSAGRVGIGTNAPVTSALLELNSSSQGFLLPRMLEAEREAISSPATGLMVYTTDGSFPGVFYFDGVEWVRMVVPNSVGGVLVKNKTSDESLSNSTTLQDDDDLTIPLTAGQTWIIDGFLRIIAGSNQPDFKFAFTVPAGATITAGFHVNENATNILAGALTASGQSQDVNLSSNQPSVLIYKIMIVNGGNAGDFRIQWAQRNSNGTPVIVESGSFFIASRVQ